MAAHRLASRRQLLADMKTLTADRGRLEAENSDLACRIPRLAREVHEARLEAAHAHIDRKTASQRADRLASELAAAVAELHRLRADIASRDAVDVPPMIRDTSDPADQATMPVHVIPLQQRSQEVA